jgi:hypothetical protein
MAVGVGLSGAACGGELDPDSKGDGGSAADAVSEFPAPVFVTQPPTPLPEIDSGSSVDAEPDVFGTPPLPPPPLHPPPTPLPPLPAMDAGFTSDASLDVQPPTVLPPPIRAPYWPELDATVPLDTGNEPPQKR